MKSYLAGLVLSVCMASAAAAPAAREPAGFDFRGVNVSQAVQLIYGEALQDAFVIDPEVVNDQRLVSFRYKAANGDLRAFVRGFLDSLGLQVTRRGGIDFIAKKPAVEDAEPNREVFVYRPRHRDGSYLIDIVMPFLTGEFSAKRGVRAAGGDAAPSRSTVPGSAASNLDRQADVLVYRGTSAEVKMLTGLLKKIDVPGGGVSVRAVLYEVQTGTSSASAFSLAMNVLGSRLGVDFGTRPAAGSSQVSLSTANFELVLSALASDSRFVVRSSPNLSVRSGKSARLTVGQDAPVLSAVSYSGANGTPVQSVEYRSAGVIFDLSPVVHEDGIDLALSQQVSNFVRTETGVNNSPTLIKREIKTDLSVKDGELLVVGGLTDDKESKANSGLPFVPSFLHSKSNDKTRTEILLLLQVSKLAM